MKRRDNSSSPVLQRWMRPFNAPPGFWKQQLATWHLELAARGDMKSLQQLLIANPEYLSKRGNHNRTLGRQITMKLVAYPNLNNWCSVPSSISRHCKFRKVMPL